jgi:hypothetical protein
MKLFDKYRGGSRAAPHRETDHPMMFISTQYLRRKNSTFATKISQISRTELKRSPSQNDQICAVGTEQALPIVSPPGKAQPSRMTRMET